MKYWLFVAMVGCSSSTADPAPGPEAGGLVAFSPSTGGDGFAPNAGGAPSSGGFVTAKGGARPGAGGIVGETGGVAAATGGAPPTGGAPVISEPGAPGKKGAGTWWFGGVNQALADAKAMWFYDWYPTTQGITTPSGVEFVPMIWDIHSVDRGLGSIQSAEGPTLLGFNEPDHTDQANL